MYPPPAFTNEGLKEQPYPPGFIIQPPPPPYYTPPGPMPTQTPAPTMVISTQPYVVAMPQRPYRDYMVLSMATLLLFCWPLGIAAVMYSSKTRDALRRGDPLMAAQYSHTAWIINIVGMVIGSLGHAAWIIYVIYFYSTRGGYHIQLYG
ncbi:proline rich transmembrane protein 1B-like [Hyla sarda]|uniref:proline rich transmembrane protein 1B-like n=1 Tax=Hyla sarda TaxID=327740 RepID=UPI0024C45748|nr:proline rich transmembrane protein 1B-like [Hyla sarda]